MALYIIDNAVVTTGGMRFFNPVRLERNAVRRGDTASLQRRRPDRSPYDFWGHPTAQAKAVRLHLETVGNCGVLLSWNDPILDGYVISRTWS
jgi:hypothetical protein